MILRELFQRAFTHVPIDAPAEAYTNAAMDVVDRWFGSVTDAIRVSREGEEDPMLNHIWSMRQLTVEWLQILAEEDL